MKASNPNYIPTLDGWRAVAILFVLFEHGSFFTLRPFAWTSLGGHGVEIFFVISGYLITGKLLEDASLSRFYLRRVFRILPVLFSYMSAVAVVGFGLHRIPLERSEVAASLLFVRNYCNYPLLYQTGRGWFTAHLWSLSIEEQFYLIWPLVLLKVGRGTPRRQLLAALILFGLGCAILALVAVGRTFHLGGWHWLPNVKFGGLVIGCVLRIALNQAPVAVKVGRLFSGRSLLVVVLAFVYFVIFHARVTLFDPIVCGLALCATLASPNASAGRVLELSPLRWIGRLSYSLYIWQQLFTAFALVYRPFEILSAFPINMMVLVAVACASYYGLEKPMMRLGHRLVTTQARAEPIPIEAP